MDTHTASDATRLKWTGRWNEMKGLAKQKWGELTDDDLDVAEGKYEELIGTIQQRTGESAQEIERKLNEA